MGCFWQQSQLIRKFKGASCYSTYEKNVTWDCSSRYLHLSSSGVALGDKGGSGGGRDLSGLLRVVLLSSGNHSPAGSSEPSAHSPKAPGCPLRPSPTSSRIPDLRGMSPPLCSGSCFPVF